MPTAVPWTDADNKWKQNLSSTTATNATSLNNGSFGPNGTDVAYPIQLSATRWLWLFGDSWWPTAAGQTRGASRLIGNMVALQVGAVFTTSTLTFHCGPRPGGSGTVSNTDPWAFFRHRGHPSLEERFAQPGCVRYPMAGVRLNTNMVLVVGMVHMTNMHANPDITTSNWQGVGGAAGTYPVGPFAVILHGNIDGANPNAWAHQEVEVDLPLSGAGFGQRMGFHFGGGCEIDGDHLLLWCNGPWDQTGHWALCRYPLSEVEQGYMRAPEWWAGDHRWVADRENAQRRIRVTPAEVMSEQSGNVAQRVDGRYQLTVIPQPFYDPDSVDRQQGLAEIKYAIADAPGETFGPLKTMYLIPTLENDYDFKYGSNLVTGQTWPGNFDPDGQLIVFSTHNSEGSGLGAAVLSNTRLYWPKMLQVAEVN